MNADPATAGLQAERTQLSWERTAIGFLAGGAIPLLRAGGPLAVGRTMLAITAVVLALMVIWLGHARAKRISTGEKVVPAPLLEARLLGWATAGFAALIVGLLLFFG